MLGTNPICVAVLESFPDSLQYPQADGRHYQDDDEGNRSLLNAEAHAPASKGALHDFIMRARASNASYWFAEWCILLSVRRVGYRSCHPLERHLVFAWQLAFASRGKYGAQASTAANIARCPLTI